MTISPLGVRPQAQSIRTNQSVLPAAPSRAVLLKPAPALRFGVNQNLQQPKFSTLVMENTLRKIATRPAYQAHFGELHTDVKGKFSRSEAYKLADAIIQSNKVHDDTPTKIGSYTELVDAIEKGREIPTSNNGQYMYGMLRKLPNGDFRLITTTRLFKQVMEHVLSQPEVKALQMPVGKDEVAIAIKIRDDESIEAVDHFIEKELKPFYRVVGEMPLDKPAREPLKNRVKRLVPGLKNKVPKWEPTEKTLQIDETIVWPFFETLLSPDRKMPNKVQELADKLFHIPIYEMACPDAPELEKSLTSAFAPLRKNLAGLMAMEEHYVNSVEQFELLLALAVGCTLGLGGESIAEHVIHGEGMAALARSATIGLVDAGDNMAGAWAIISRRIRDAGQKLGIKSIFGKDSLKEAAKNRFRLEGPAGQPLREGGKSAIEGAAVGTVMSWPLNTYVLAGAGSGALANAAAGGLISIGTAMAIPFNVRKKKVAAYVAVQNLIEQGKIEVPVSKDRNTYADLITEQDICSQIEFASSTKSMPLVPLISGGILGMEGILNLCGIFLPHSLFMLIFMAGAASMENLLTLVLVQKRLRQFPGMVENVRTMILEAPTKGFNREHLRSIFADRGSRTMCDAITVGCKLPPLSQLQRLKTETSPVAEESAKHESKMAVEPDPPGKQEPARKPEEQPSSAA